MHGLTLTIMALTVVVLIALVTLVLKMKRHQEFKKCPGSLLPKPGACPTSRYPLVNLWHRLVDKLDWGYGKPDPSTALQEKVCSTLSLIGNHISAVSDIAPMLASIKESESITNHLLQLTHPAITHVSQGRFYFSTPLLLEVLPNDFSQNQLTPYGLVAFTKDHLLSIPTLTKVRYLEMLEKCNFPELLPLIKWLSSYSPPPVSPPPTTLMKYNRPRDASFPSLSDEVMYDAFGCLGANPLNPEDGYILAGTLPLKSLRPRYFSFILYLADRYDPSNMCAPVQHSLFASILPPFNLFDLPTRQRQRDITFAILIARHPSVMQGLRTVLQTRKIDVVHEFCVPERPFPVHASAPNPNGITVNRPVFDTQTDRWAILARFVPEDSKGSAWQEFKRAPPITVHRISWTPSVPQASAPFPYHNQFSPTLPPLQTFSPTWYNAIAKQINHGIVSASRRPNSVATIKVLPSITCLFAPGDPKARTGFYPYVNGLLAIQTAGTALGDNPDCWYKFSKSFCLPTEESVAVVLGVNHAHMDNALYCNINVNHTEKSSSVAEKSYFRPSPEFMFYVTLVGRNAGAMQQMAQAIRKSLVAKFSFDFVPILVSANTIPLGHHFNIVERAYINPSVFWEGQQVPFEQAPDTLHASMTKPDGAFLLSPVVWTTFLNKK